MVFLRPVTTPINYSNNFIAANQLAHHCLVILLHSHDTSGAFSCNTLSRLSCSSCLRVATVIFCVRLWYSTKFVGYSSLRLRYPLLWSFISYHLAKWHAIHKTTQRIAPIKPAEFLGGLVGSFTPRLIAFSLYPSVSPVLEFATPRRGSFAGLGLLTYSAASLNGSAAFSVAVSACGLIPPLRLNGLIRWFRLVFLGVRLASVSVVFGFPTPALEGWTLAA